MTPARVLHFIDGGPAEAASGASFEDRDPATGELLAHVARGDAADVDRAVDAGHRALAGAWGATSVDERAALLERTAALLEARADEAALLESEDSGKPLALARRLDIPRAIANLRFFAQAVRQAGAPCHPMADALNYTVRKPLGVVALITPWNLPLYLLTWKAAPALAMGNAVVAKPSELTPRTASLLAELLTEAGAPSGAFNVVHGFGAEAGEPLCAHAGVRGVSFTGGTATGARVAQVAAPGFKKLSLELGGKNATLVFADADLEAAADGAVRAAFTNQGQICLCGSRVLVEASIHDRFLDAMVARVARLRTGDPRDPASDLGALISHAHRDKVEGYLRLAREEGGTVRVGGGRPALQPPLDGGAFLEPTLVSGLAPGCRTATEEIFGPVATVHPFTDEAEALAMANGVRYGLSASLWTRDLARAHRAAARLDVGMVWVNTWLHRDLRVPFGGVKQSGVGREGGGWSLEFFSEAVNVCVHLGERS
ncbi:MAG: aldehyde dehydrogenase [Deltaproteobacteria bacterium]|nr:aldehyde dehydrogenase [Deltaproteobacteria bacterium]MCB9788813.1 aldehyde dehydrogenase [Deltaproteobacteria bacterium]